MEHKWRTMVSNRGQYSRRSHGFTRRALQAGGSQSSQDSQEVGTECCTRGRPVAEGSAKTRQDGGAAAAHQSSVAPDWTGAQGRGPCSDRRRSRGRHCLGAGREPQTQKEKALVVHTTELQDSFPLG